MIELKSWKEARGTRCPDPLILYTNKLNDLPKITEQEIERIPGPQHHAFSSYLDNKKFPTSFNEVVRDVLGPL